MNKNFGKLDNNVFSYAPSAFVEPSIIIMNPSAHDYAVRGWLPVVENNQPTGKVGVYYTPSGWEQIDGVIYRTWEEHPIVAPEPTPRKFSKLKIYGAISSLPPSNDTTAWEKVETWLRGKEVNGINGWMAFQLAQEISEDHPLFAAWAEEARVLLGLSVEQFEALLTACILEG